MDDHDLLDNGWQTKATNRWLWWEGRRMKYNIALLKAGGIAAGMTNIFVLSLIPDVEVFGFLFAITLFVALAIMTGANICYFSGYLFDRFLNTDDSEGLRRNLYQVGYYGSMAVPFLIPLWILLMLFGQWMGF